MSNADIKEIKNSCEKNNLPLIEEYDFKQDRKTPDLQIEMKSTTQVRDYQEASLAKMFSNGRARSGIIVLPCGAGKTLTGILATSYIKKPTLVLCNCNVSVDQWLREFCTWSSLGKMPIRFTAKAMQGNRDFGEEMFNENEAGIVISTYTMISFSGRRNS